MNSFNSLLELHRELDELFYQHQRALMRLDLDGAQDLLRKYEAGLLKHMHDEESVMLPLYDERVKPPVGGAVDIFLTEHEKLRQFLALFLDEIENIRSMVDIERGILFLIDSQHLFKRLLVHHDAREKTILYPLLDEVTSAVERQELLARIESRSADLSSSQRIQAEH
jgi:hemerythrin-like domain-containing protein